MGDRFLPDQPKVFPGHERSLLPSRQNPPGWEGSDLLFVGGVFAWLHAVVRPGTTDARITREPTENHRSQ